MNDAWIAFVAVMTVTACTPMAEREESSQPVARAAASPDTPVDTMTPVASPPRRASSPEAQDEASATPPDAPQFHLVARVDEKGDEGPALHWRVFDVQGQVFVTNGPQVMRVSADGILIRDPSWLAGIDWQGSEAPGAHYGTAVWDALTLGGQPEALHLVIAMETGFRNDSYPNKVYRRANDRWVEVRSKGKHFHAYPAKLAPWSDGQVLALRRFTPDYAFFAYEDENDGPSKARVTRAARSIAKAKKLVVIRGTGKAPDLGHDNYQSFDALATGEIMAVVARASDTDPARVVHFDPKGQATRELPLPEADLDRSELTIVAPDDAWVFGAASTDVTEPYLAHFDGHAWTRKEPPPCEDDGIASFSTAPGAGQWAICGFEPQQMWWSQQAQLWHRPDRGAWQAVTLPGGGKVIEVLARGPDDVWVAGDGIFHTRPPKSVLVAPGLEALVPEVLEHADPVEPFDCDFATVLIERDPEGDHAELVAALNDALSGIERNVFLSLVEVQFRGESRLALQSVPEKAKPRVRRAVAAALGDAMGDTWCVAREATRELASWERS